VDVRRVLLALALTCAACKGESSAPTYQPSGFKPDGATRTTPPPAIEAAALPVGARVPDVDLTATTGRFTLADALSKKERVLLVLYRGDW
jgi:hypothetical protein